VADPCSGGKPVAAPVGRVQPLVGRVRRPGTDDAAERGRGRPRGGRIGASPDAFAITAAGPDDRGEAEARGRRSADRRRSNTSRGADQGNPARERIRQRMFRIYVNLLDIEELRAEVRRLQRERRRTADVNEIVRIDQHIEMVRARRARSSGGD
jgi:hypothetical protein